MSVLRQQNWVGQQRIDVPHLRSLDSGVAADFDLLAGRILAGNTAYIVRGFELSMTNAINGPATALQLVVAGATMMHPLASETGTIFSVDPSAPLETLSVTNSRVIGGFTASADNFIGIDVRRLADASTADLVMVLDASSRIQTPKTIPLARTLDFRIVISTTDFSATPHICPVAKVTTNSSNAVTAIADVRQMWLRLGRGGSNPDSQYAFPWLSGRKESATGATTFQGGDKQLLSAKDMLDALMTRSWELGGGEFWYSPTSDRDVKLAKGQSLIVATGDNFAWTLGSQTLQWQSLSLIFANSTATFNDIVDGSISPLNDGECIYVDADRSANRTGGTALVVAKAALTTLGSPKVPGSRFVIAWRKGNLIFVRDRDYEVGRSFSVATTAAQGTVRLSYAPGNVGDPLVAPLDANGTITATATGGNAQGLNGIGNGTGTGVTGTGGATNGKGGSFVGIGSGDGVGATGGGSSGVGGRFAGGAGNATGCKGTGSGTGTGVHGTGGPTNGTAGVTGDSSAANGIGVQGTGSGTGDGVLGLAGATIGSIGVHGIGPVAGGTGVQGNGGTAGGIGGIFAGTVTGQGANCVGGATDGTIGCTGSSNATNGHGLKGTGSGTGDGVQGTAGGTGSSFRALSGPITTAAAVDIGKVAERFGNAHIDGTYCYNSTITAVAAGDEIKRTQVNAPIASCSFDVNGGAPVLATRHWNVLTVTGPSSGKYTVTFDRAISTDSVVALSFETKVVSPAAADFNNKFIGCKWTSTTTLDIYTTNGTSLIDFGNTRIHLTVTGSPSAFL